MAKTKTKKNKCQTIEKGDVQIEGVDGEVFRRVYESHKRGTAMFYNNRKGVKLTAYPDVRKVIVDGNERRFNKEQTMDAYIVKMLNREVAQSDSE